MAHENKWYMGLMHGKRETFLCPFNPTRETHGRLYNAVIGPFDTKEGAEFMAQHGHCQTVDEAERLAVTAT